MTATLEQAREAWNFLGTDQGTQAEKDQATRVVWDYLLDESLKVAREIVDPIFARARKVEP